MNNTEIIFWLLILLIFYSYIGYALMLGFIVWVKKMVGIQKENPSIADEDLPEITLFVAAFNEKDYIDIKQRDYDQLDYPNAKLRFIWVTDGSDDGSPDLLKKYPEVELYHEPERKGKISAMNRGMQFVQTPIVVFSDCNTRLGKHSIRKIAELMADPKVGCVAGEKRISTNEKDTASGAGEGIYWKYESLIKRWEADLSSVIGAAGELFAVRTELYEEVEKDTLLDDFIISLRIAMKGYRVQYHPEAYAIEDASLNVTEELKRKVRISAGAIQSIIRLKALLNFFNFGWLSLQYISHKVLRWTLVPLALLIIIPLNFLLFFDEAPTLPGNVYGTLLMGQILFYAVALMGWYFENKKIQLKIFFVPYYFFIMNLSVYLGFFRYIKGKQSVNWEKAKRVNR
ncbi:MAG: glycosyltransferase family 2 protein [Bacteroidales bacterium]|nr:glycosyltransferase family 2 protein [Bacteroidales bacterium]MCF8456055.1 glycosyltransferase family 2 protein [Bacteroidales bacterium]